MRLAHGFWLSSLILLLLLSGCGPVHRLPQQASAAPAVSAPDTSTTPAVPTGQLDDKLVAMIDSYAEANMKLRKTPGMAVGIVQDGKVVFSKGYGAADVETGAPVTPQTVFNLGNLSYQFTAVAIMQLVEQGKIDLDAPFAQYLPGFTMADDRYKAITVRQLLTHMAGLDYAYEADWSLPLEEMWQSFEPAADEDARARYLAFLADQRLLDEPPSWLGGDTEYNLLGAVIEAVSGQNFESYMHDHIFAPLGMNHSSFIPTELDPALLAQPHVTGLDGQPVRAALYPYHRPWAPSSGLVSNVEDMTRWMIVGANRGELDGVRILSPATYDLLWGNEADTGEFRPDGKPLYYGLGWYVFQNAGKAQVGHPGLNLGFVTDIGYFPDERSGVVVMANRLDSVFDPRVSDEVVGQIFGYLGFLR